MAMAPTPMLALIIAVIVLVAWLILEIRNARRRLRVPCGCLLFIAMCFGVFESHLYGGVAASKGDAMFQMSVDHMIRELEENRSDQLRVRLEHYRQHREFGSLYHLPFEFNDALTDDAWPVENPAPPSP
jgi:hypothetical protein